MGIIRIIIDWL